MTLKRCLNLQCLFIFVLLCILSAGSVTAATLHGKVYDIQLNELNNVIIEADSEPPQRYLSKDGSYSFELNPGDYEITARYTADDFYIYTTAENISITDDGDYVFDLFLFPELELDDELALDGEVIDVPDEILTETINGRIWISLIAVLAILLLVVLYFLVSNYRKNRKLDEKEELETAEALDSEVREDLREELEDAGLENARRCKQLKPVNKETIGTDLEEVIGIIKKHGGRTTQKELRKEIPLSEAKISLMISELEGRKIIRKIKKGRGNIIILNR